jgi:hypothetical protein
VRIDHPWPCSVDSPHAPHRWEPADAYPAPVQCPGVKVSGELRKRIIDAVEQSGYHPEDQADAAIAALGLETE